MLVIARVVLEVGLREVEGEAGGGAGFEVGGVFLKGDGALFAFAGERADGGVHAADGPFRVVDVEIHALARLINRVGIPIGLRQGVPAALDPRLHVERNAAFAGKGARQSGDAVRLGGAFERLDIDAVERRGRVFGIVALEGVFAVGDVEIAMVFGGEFRAECGIGLDIGDGVVHGGLLPVFGDSARAAPEADFEAGGAPAVRPAFLKSFEVVGARFAAVVDLQSDPGDAGELEVGGEVVNRQGRGGVNEDTGFVEEDVGRVAGGILLSATRTPRNFKIRGEEKAAPQGQSEAEEGFGKSSTQAHRRTLTAQAMRVKRSQNRVNVHQIQSGENP